MFNYLPHDLNAKTYRQEQLRKAEHGRMVMAAEEANHTSSAIYAPVLAMLGHIMASMGVWLEGRYSTRRHQHDVPGVPGYGQSTG